MSNFDTPMRRFYPREYDEMLAIMRRAYSVSPAILRLSYATREDKLSFHYASVGFYERYDDLLSHSVAWERYDADGVLVDHYESLEFAQRYGTLPIFGPGIAARQANLPWQAQAAAQQMQFDPVNYGCITEAAPEDYQAAAQRHFAIANLAAAQMKQLTDAQLRALGLNVQKTPAPTPGIANGELWWQTEQREAAVKRDELVAMRADVRRMLMGG